MATLRNKLKLAAFVRKTQKEHLWDGLSGNTSVSRINQEHITQLSEEIEGKITIKLSQEFSRTESRILVALSDLDEFLFNPQIRTHSGTVPRTFRNTKVENQEPNEASHPDKARHMVTAVQEEIRNRHHMVRGVLEENRYRNHSLTRFRDEIPYCSPEISSGKQN